MKRRKFMIAGAAGGLMLGLRPAFGAFDPRPGPWRSFALATRVNVLKTGGQVEGAGKPVQVWLPLPSLEEAVWQTSVDDTWTGNYTGAEVVTDAASGARILHATYAADIAEPVIELTSVVRTRSRGGPAGEVVPLSAEERSLFTAATELLPTDGIVRETADKITAGAGTDEEKARAIYEWIVENTQRVAEVRGCGIGDVASMLATGNLGGKCADLNALMVALARSVGVPARDLYGIRVAPSAFGYKSLGAGSETVTKAQHCRAEVWLEARGWVPVDPADVRKVVLEEPPGKNALDSTVVSDARAKLFGAWEGNWVGFNDAHDVTLPGSDHQVAFLMYPQAEVGNVLLDCLAPDTFAYTVTAKEVAA